MNAPTDPTKERSQHEDDVLERIAKIVAPGARDEVNLRRRRRGGAGALRGTGRVSTDVAVAGQFTSIPTSSPLRDLGYKAVRARCRTWPPWARGPAGW